MQNKKWARLLAYVTGLVNQQLLRQNEYLAAENRILRSHLPAHLRLSDPERSTLAEIGRRLGRKGLEKVASVAQPDTILAWYRRLSAPTSVRAPRPRHEVRRGIPGDTGRRRSEVPATPSAEPELECFCGTLGAIGQRGVSIEADPVRGSFVEEGANRIPRASPRRKKSSGQGQQAAVSSTHSTGISPSWEGSMPGTIRWAAQVL